MVINMEYPHLYMGLNKMTYTPQLSIHIIYIYICVKYPHWVPTLGIIWAVLMDYKPPRKGEAHPSNITQSP